MSDIRLIKRLAIQSGELNKEVVKLLNTNSLEAVCSFLHHFIGGGSHPSDAVTLSVAFNAGEGFEDVSIKDVKSIGLRLIKGEKIEMAKNTSEFARVWRGMLDDGGVCLL